MTAHVTDRTALHQEARVAQPSVRMPIEKHKAVVANASTAGIQCPSVMNAMISRPRKGLMLVRIPSARPAAIHRPRRADTQTKVMGPQRIQAICAEKIRAPVGANSRASTVMDTVATVTRSSSSRKISAIAQIADATLRTTQIAKRFPA